MPRETTRPAATPVSSPDSSVVVERSLVRRLYSPKTSAAAAMRLTVVHGIAPGARGSGVDRDGRHRPETHDAGDDCGREVDCRERDVADRAFQDEAQRQEARDRR